MKAHEKILKLININKQVSCQPLTPCLIGHSGVGKTERVFMLGKELNLPVKVLLLHSMLPEEVLGLPRVIDGKTIWSLPEWFTEEPMILFLDELDKAREETIASVLTLMASRHIRGNYLHPETIIITGMQPNGSDWLHSETGIALLERVVFVPVTDSEGISYLENKYSVNLNWLQFPKLEIAIRKEVSIRRLEYLIQAFNILKKKEVFIELFQDSFDKDFLNLLVQNLKNNFSFLTAKEIVVALNDDLTLLDDLDIPQLIQIAGEIFHYGNPKTIVACEKKILLGGTADDWERYNSNRYEYLMKEIEAAGGELEVCNGATEEELFAEYEKEIPQVIDKLNKLKEQSK